MTLSKEQETAVALSKKEGKLSIKAFAGCSKTFTMIEIAKANPNITYLLLVFSKALQTETENKLKKLGIKNVIAKTTHSLAYSIVFQNKHKVRNKDYKAYDLVDMYKISKDASYLVFKLVNSYFNNNDSSYKILLNKYKKLDSKIGAGHVKVANKFIGDMRSNKIDVTHSFYLKEYQLKVINEGVSYKKYQGVMLDEAQDTNTVTKSIFDNIKVPYKVKVGDNYQAIFGWRGATNIMNDLDGWRETYLTTSFRTPKELAKHSDRFLKIFRGEKETFKGFKDKVESPTGNDSFAVISRTNSGMIKYMAKLIEKGHKFRTIRHPNEIFSAVMDISNLSNGNMDRINDKSFLKIPEMMNKYNKKNPKSTKKLFGYILDELDDVDREAVQAVNLINAHSSKTLYDIRRKAIEYYESKEYIKTNLTTAHTAKGLEWDNILVTDDYPNIFELAYQIAYKYYDPRKLTYEKYLDALDKYDNHDLIFDEMNLFYVACTRAMKSFKIDGENRVYLTKYDKNELIDRLIQMGEEDDRNTDRVFDKEISKEIKEVKELIFN